MTDRGFITWNPRGSSLETVDMIRAVLREYEDHLPLTMRQVFYRLVGRFNYEKTERAYKRLLYVAAKARRAEMIDFDHVRDDGVTVEEAPGYSGFASFVATVRSAAKHYARDRQIGQPRRIILLCEAAGMVPQLARVAHEFGVEVRSSGGFDSVTAKFELASHVAKLDMPVVLLHLGDLDPSGESIFEVIRDDVGAFVRHMTIADIPYGPERIGNGTVEAVRLAVTRAQAEEMQLPSAPAKETDSRARNFQGETVQCEAIPPDVLNEIVRDAIRARIDADVFEANLAQEREERARIAQAMQSFAA